MGFVFKNPFSCTLNFSPLPRTLRCSAPLGTPFPLLRTESVQMRRFWGLFGLLPFFVRLCHLFPLSRAFPFGDFFTWETHGSGCWGAGVPGAGGAGAPRAGASSHGSRWSPSPHHETGSGLKDALKASRRRTQPLAAAPAGAPTELGF